MLARDRIVIDLDRVVGAPTDRHASAVGQYVDRGDCVLCEHEQAIATYARDRLQGSCDPIDYHARNVTRLADHLDGLEPPRDANEVWILSGDAVIGAHVPVAAELRAPRALRSALVSTFRRLMRLYFRDIERIGTPPPSDTRGRVFVANHTNALIDPVLVLTRDAANR